MICEPNLMDFMYSQDEIDEYYQEQLRMEEERKKAEEDFHNKCIKNIHTLYEFFSNTPYNQYSQYTVSNACEIILQGQNVNDITLFSKKYFPRLTKLDLSNNHITILEKFDHENLVLYISRNPIKLIKSSFNFDGIANKSTFLSVIALDLTFFENLETYVSCLYNIRPNDIHQTNDTNIIQLDYNLYGFIKPSLYEIMCNKIQKKKYKKYHNEEYQEFLSIIDKTLLRFFKEEQLDNCLNCEKINILYPRIISGNVITYKGNYYNNVLNKCVDTRLCYECYNKENK